MEPEAASVAGLTLCSLRTTNLTEAVSPGMGPSKSPGVSKSLGRNSISRRQDIRDKMTVRDKSVCVGQSYWPGTEPSWTPRWLETGSSLSHPTSHSRMGMGNCSVLLPHSGRTVINTIAFFTLLENIYLSVNEIQVSYEYTKRCSTFLMLIN